MAFFGLFGKKKSAMPDMAPPPSVGMPRPVGMPSRETISQEPLPDVPPLEDLDLPPPPAYPRAAQPTPPPTPVPRPTIETPPQITPSPAPVEEKPLDMFVSDKPFGVTEAPRVELKEPKFEVPLEKMTLKKEEPKPTFEVPKEVARFEREGPSKEEIIKDVERRKEPTGPLFVHVDDYRGILEGTTHVRNNLKEAGDIVVRMNELKNEEDKEFERWRGELEDIQRKLTYIDKIIFESS